MLFINRELSWLNFNKRVLEEAHRSRHPLMEQVRFLSIAVSNLDEFFMVRVGSLHNHPHAVDICGLTAEEQLVKIANRVRDLVREVGAVYNHVIIPKLRKKTGLSFKTKTENSFYNELIPHLCEKTPEEVGNLTLCVFDGSTLREVPPSLPRLIPIGKNHYHLLEDLILHFMPSCTLFRITRNADLSFDTDLEDNPIHAMEERVELRKSGAAVRLEIADSADIETVDILRKKFNLSYRDVYRVSTPLDLSFLKNLFGIVKKDIYYYKPFPAALPHRDKDLFTHLKKQDILLHHPYDSFSYVVDFLSRAAEDPKVTAIYQTLYRVSSSSPIVHALEKAALGGKQVTVMVELKARFDEERNIQWARELEKAGCHVCYGSPERKVHAKLLLIKRREKEGERRYLHLGTGNYHDINAGIYTDFSLLTADERMADDAETVFDVIQGKEAISNFHLFGVAPYSLRETLLRCLKREERAALAGRRAWFFAKMNALSDPEIIQAVYRASCVGVKVELVVRGICCLRPQNENITVRSVVGRFLEHSRIYAFCADGKEEYYLSSADCMPRNLNRRVEVIFPVTDASCVEKLRRAIARWQQDTDNSSILQRNGSYLPCRGKNGRRRDCHKQFIEEKN